MIRRRSQSRSRGFERRPARALSKGFAPIGVLRDLCVFGYEPIEDGVLAGLLLGEPILLIGGVGSGKTFLVEAIARALGLRFWAYDASKAMFEDVVGFPDPRTMQDGRVEYLPAPLTLWGKQFILVDELSRATATMQNKWLEVIRSRRLMGMPLQDLRYIVGAMNPPGLFGTYPLDPALADRFTFVLTVPAWHDMIEADRFAVIENLTDADEVGVRAGRPQAAVLSRADRLAALIERATEAYRRAGPLEPLVVRYVDAVLDYLVAKDPTNFHAGGRRAGMMKRGILALVALHQACGSLKSGLHNLPSDLCRHALDMVLPFPAVGRPVQRLILDAAHAHGIEVLRTGASRTLPFERPIEAARRMVACDPDTLDTDQASALVTRVAEILDHPQKIEATIEAATALWILMSASSVQTRLRPDTRHHLFSVYRDVTMLEPAHWSDFVEATKNYQAEVPLPPARRLIGNRIAFNLARRLNRLPTVDCDFETFASGFWGEVAQTGGCP